MRQGTRLVVAHFKVQVLDVGAIGATPVAAEERVRADHVERAGDGSAGVLRHHQQHVLRHGLPKHLEELARQVRLAPLPVCARAHTRVII